MTDTPTGRPAAPPRYGRPPMPAATRRRVAIVLGALAVLLGIVVAAVAYQRFERVPVEGKMAAYEVLDDGRSVAVTISVTRSDPAIPVVCIVRARSQDGAETGRREILVGPADAATVQITAKVTSYARPFVGDIYGCGTDVPEYLVAS